MNTLVRWDPYREMLTLRSMVDRMFDNTLPATTWQPAVWDVALDVAETDEEFLVKASLPGINPNDLEITYNANVLSIKGEVREEKETEQTHYHVRERRYGSFCRNISLPSTVKADAIEANYESGVLILHLPKAEEAKPKRIPVQNVAAPKVIEGKVADIKNKN